MNKKPRSVRLMFEKGSTQKRRLSNRKNSGSNRLSTTSLEKCNDDKRPEEVELLFDCKRPIMDNDWRDSAEILIIHLPQREEIIGDI
jgi:hypothetical protein